MVLWDGIYENSKAQWLRWAAADGEPIATGAERAETLEAKLLELVIDPDTVN
ncbi:MAG: hypothetical protein AAF236_08665 [Verrucomicrobiota bacterium]